MAAHNKCMWFDFTSVTTVIPNVIYPTVHRFSYLCSRSLRLTTTMPMGGEENVEGESELSRLNDCFETPMSCEVMD